MKVVSNNAAVRHAHQQSVVDVKTRWIDHRGHASGDIVARNSVSNQQLVLGHSELVG